MNESTGNQIRKREDCWIIFGEIKNGVPVN